MVYFFNIHHEIKKNGKSHPEKGEILELALFLFHLQICSKMGTRNFKIDREKPQINKCKVGIPQNLIQP